jgi:hypothetical protein
MSATFEVSFIPTKREVHGAHQPDIAYQLGAENAEQAKSAALVLLGWDGLRASYRFQKICEVEPE